MDIGYLCAPQTKKTEGYEKGCSDADDKKCHVSVIPFRRKQRYLMKKIFFVSFMGLFLLWAGTVYADPGRPLILGRANVLDLGIGLMRGMVNTSNALLTGKADGSFFYAWRGGLVRDDADFVGDTFDNLDGSNPWHKDTSMRVLLTGLGWDNAVHKKQKWELVMDMGVAVQIPPEVEMTTAGRLVLNSHSDDKLINGEKQLAEQLGNFQYYPLLTFGLKYHF